jgi:hypothetical protein
MSPGTPEPLKTTITRTFFYTTEEALGANCQKFIMRCATENYTWCTRNKTLPSFCRKCGHKTGERIFPIAALIERGIGSKQPNLITNSGHVYQAYPILNMVKAYKEVHNELHNNVQRARILSRANQIDEGGIL